MRFLRISSAQGLNHSSIVFGKQKLISLDPEKEGQARRKLRASPCFSSFRQLPRPTPLFQIIAPGDPHRSGPMRPLLC
jgi:hypothetical protein